MSAAVTAALGRWVPSAAVVAGDATAAWRFGGRPPEAIVFPASNEQVAAIVTSAGTEGWRVIPAGAGTWLDGASTPAVGRPTVVLSTRRLDRILAYEPADLTLTAQGGVSLGAIQTAAARHGQWLPLDPAPDDHGTLGATLATASAGPLATAYGSPRDLTLGVEIVTADGTILSPGGRVVKNVAGFDLVRLMVGGWGVFGVVTGATLRLYPRPKADLTLLLESRHRTDVLEAARAVATSPVPVAALEIADPSPSDASCAAVVCRVVGSTPDAEAVAAKVEATHPASGWRRLTAEEARQAHSVLRGLDGRGQIVLRLALLPALLGRALQLIREFGEGLALGETGAISRVGDAKTGRVRIALRREPSVRDAALADAIRGLRRVTEDEGGSLRITRAPAELIAAVKPWGDLGSVRRLVEGVRTEFDPRGVFPWERFGV